MSEKELLQVAENARFIVCQDAGKHRKISAPRKGSVISR